MLFYHGTTATCARRHAGTNKWKRFRLGGNDATKKKAA
jgi:hypothetical protein